MQWGKRSEFVIAVPYAFQYEQGSGRQEERSGEIMLDGLGSIVQEEDRSNEDIRDAQGDFEEPLGSLFQREDESEHKRAHEGRLEYPGLAVIRFDDVPEEVGGHDWGW